MLNLQTKLVRIGSIYDHFHTIRLWFTQRSQSTIGVESQLAVAQLLGASMLALHIIACGFYFISRQTGTAATDATEAAGWSFRDAAIASDPSTVTKYIRSLYWVLTTYATVGFGTCLLWLCVRVSIDV